MVYSILDNSKRHGLFPKILRMFNETITSQCVQTLKTKNFFTCVKLRLRLKWVTSVKLNLTFIERKPRESIHLVQHSILKCPHPANQPNWYPLYLHCN